VKSFDQADSFLRPFKRRAFKIARPARVDMRARKPCLAERRFWFGWYVRFITNSSIPGFAPSGRETPGSGQYSAASTTCMRTEPHNACQAHWSRLRAKDRWGQP